LAAHSALDFGLQRFEPAAVVALVGINITRQLRLGYAYDFTMTDMSKYSDGTHEITLGYDFGTIF